MVMSGLELALDLSRNDFNMNVRSSRNSLDTKQSATPTIAPYSIYDAGLQYIAGEFGGYQTVLRKERCQYLSVAMFALNTSEPEKRSASRSSDTSGVSSMASGSYADQSSSLNLVYQNEDVKPVINESRNILDISTNIQCGSTFFYNPPQRTSTVSVPITPSLNNMGAFEDENKTFTCPKCGFVMPLECLPNGGVGYKCIL